MYRATDTKLNRSVAIKVLLPAVADDADRLAQFSREAQVLASLNHPVGSIDSVYLSPADPSQLSATEDSSDWLLRVGDSGRAPLPRDAHWHTRMADGRPLGHRNDTW